MAYNNSKDNNNVIKVQDDLIRTLLHSVKQNSQTFNSSTPQWNISSLPTIYMITPTYSRWTQKADLLRLCFTLMHVPKIHWIVIEDSYQKSKLVEGVLSGNNSCKISNVTYLNLRTPKKLWTYGTHKHHPRGVLQRNLAIDWLRESSSRGMLGDWRNSLKEESVVYFADDDNTYDIELFNEMRYTEKVSVWPVGIVGGLKFEGPLCRNGKVIGWHTSFATSRPFPLDMAGFAINLQYLLSKPNVHMDSNSKNGYVESSFLMKLTTIDELEPKADNCSKVLVWHTRTEEPGMEGESKLIKQGNPSNFSIEV